jgi:hypothetical protein
MCWVIFQYFNSEECWGLCELQFELKWSDIQHGIGSTREIEDKKRSMIWFGNSYGTINQTK